MAALAISVDTREIIAGPLSLPGRAGCWHCARTRMAGAEAAARAMGEEIPATGSRAPLEAAARALIDLDEGQFLDHVLIVDGATERASFHRVIPLAECPVCGGAAKFPREEKGAGVRLSEEDSPESVLAALDGWVGPRTGIIPRIAVEEQETEVLVVTAAPPYLPPRRFPIGWGKGLTLSGALLSAVGEAIERYAPSLADARRIVWKRADELDGEWLDPREFALYTTAQYEREGFPFVRFDPGVCHPWVRGNWLGSGEPVWTPAVLAYL
mgnify:CR=1 FL=1